MPPVADIIQFLESPRSELENGESLVNTMESFIEGDNHPTAYRVRDTKVRLALHFSPSEIVPDTEIESDEPRYIVCSEYISENFGFTDDNSKDIAKAVQRVLDSWSENRSSVTKYKDKLLRRQSNRCNCCNHEFGTDSLPYINEDKYKPVHEEEDLTRPHVDHIDPVWALGYNRIDNLEVLCKFCNMGKGGSKNMNLKNEFENSYSRIEEISWKHRAQLFHQTLSKYQSCAECDNSKIEMVVRPIRPEGCYTKSNLRPICTECAY